MKIKKYLSKIIPEYCSGAYSIENLKEAFNAGRKYALKHLWKNPKKLVSYSKILVLDKNGFYHIAYIKDGKFYDFYNNIDIDCKRYMKIP